MNHITGEMTTGLRVAQVLGLTSTAFLCGKTFSNSYSTIPALLLAPAPLLAKQWKKMFDSDKLLAPIVVIFSGGVFAYLGYKESTPSSHRLYLTSTTLLALSIPYSFLLLEPLNKQLEAKAEQLINETAEHGIKREETAHYLVDRWGTVNLGRTALTGVAGVLALWAALDGMRVRR